MRLLSRLANNHEVIGISREAIAGCMKFPVEVIQHNIRQERRNHPTNNVANSWLTLDIVIPRSRLKPIRGQGPDFEQVQVDKEVTSTHNVEGGVHGRNKPNKEKEISGPS